MGKLTKRQIAIQCAKVAGYHEDSSTFTRLIIESRVGRPLMNEAFLIGRKARAAGVKCGCYDCNKTTTPKTECTSQP